jgi:predicted TIM-barrel fold metal-dependent hydrolase
MAQREEHLEVEPFRIDAHYHIYPPDFMASQERLNPKWGRQSPPAVVANWSPQLALDIMDETGVAVGISQMITDPGVWFGDVAAACALSREWNEYAARLMADHPARFGMLATLPMPDIDGSLREIAYALDVLRADGVQIMSHYDAVYPGDPRFHPVLDELNRRRAIVLVHPFLPPGHSLLPGVRPRTVEFPFDSTRAIVSLVLSGATTRFPDIRFIFCHGGGTLPMLVGRIIELTKDEKDLPERVPRGIEFELKKFYYETANAYHRPSYAAISALIPSDRILFGTDFPYVSIPTTIEGLAAVEPRQETRRKIERNNALALLPRFRTAALDGAVSPRG